MTITPASPTPSVSSYTTVKTSTESMMVTHQEATEYCIYAALAIMEIAASYNLPHFFTGLNESYAPAYALVGELGLLALLYKFEKNFSKPGAREITGLVLAALSLATGGYLIGHYMHDSILGSLVGVGGFMTFASIAWTKHCERVDIALAAEQFVKAANRDDQRRIDTDILPSHPYFMQLAKDLIGAIGDNKLDEVRAILDKIPCLVHLQDDRGSSLYELLNRYDTKDMKALLKEYGGDQKPPLDPQQRDRMIARLHNALNENNELTEPTLRKILYNHPELLYATSTTVKLPLIGHPKAFEFALIRELHPDQATVNEKDVVPPPTPHLTRGVSSSSNDGGQN